MIKKILLSIFGIVGALTSGLFSTIVGITLARAVLGFGVGLATVVCPTYVSENTPPAQKGVLGTLFQLAITFGIVLAYLVVLPFKKITHGYKCIYGLGVIPSLSMLVVAILMPESPAWVERTNQGTQGKGEAQSLLVPTEGTQQAGLKVLLTHPEHRKAFFVGVVLAVAQQLTGINALMYYAPQIFVVAGITNSIVPTIGLGTWNFLTTLTSTFLVERVGRRPLLLVGTLIMLISTFLVALSFQFLHGSLVGVSAVVLLLLFVAGFEMGEGPLFWVVANDLFRPEVRGVAFSILSALTWIFNIFLTFGFLPLESVIGQSGVFWIFSSVGVVCLALMFLYLPETKVMPTQFVKYAVNE